MARAAVLWATAALSACSPAIAGDVTTYLYVLGVAQDAGYPQAGCYQPHCLRGWNDPAHRRTASAVAVVDGTAKRKYLFDATPDIGEQRFPSQALLDDERRSIYGDSEPRSSIVQRVSSSRSM